MLEALQTLLSADPLCRLPPLVQGQYGCFGLLERARDALREADGLEAPPPPRPHAQSVDKPWASSGARLRAKAGMCDVF